MLKSLIYRAYYELPTYTLYAAALFTWESNSPKSKGDMVSFSGRMSDAF